MSYSQPGSSRDQPMPDDDIPLKIRRVTKACDLCRKRKYESTRSRIDRSLWILVLTRFLITLMWVFISVHYARTRACPVFSHVLRENADMRADIQTSQARDLESRIIEMEGLIRLVGPPGIDIEQEIEESANSDLLDNANTLLRPSDSAFLQPNDAFLRPSVDSTTAFFHPSNTMFDPRSYSEEETKPDLTRLTSSAPLSPPKSSPGNTTTYSPPSAGADRSSPLSGSSHPYGITTPPRTGSAPYVNNPARDRGAGPEGRPMGAVLTLHGVGHLPRALKFLCVSLLMDWFHPDRCSLTKEFYDRLDWSSRMPGEKRFNLKLRVETRDRSTQQSTRARQCGINLPHAWLLKTDVPTQLWFPPDDLLASLVDLYFTRFNVILPLLHRPTFEAQLAQKLHWKDPSFAAVVLLVCANGSRFSDDTRVMPFYAEDIPPDMREFDAGVLFYRKYTLRILEIILVRGMSAIRDDLGICCVRAVTHFVTGQVDVCSMGVFPVDVLFEHQIMTLGAMYLTIGNPSAVLVTTGVSLRLGMQRGIHRNAWQGEVNTHNKTLNDEMWRRVFW
ncbi:fungal specific transcription factor domain-containing protein [Rhizoctonia solani AG-1 IA]|uniref:Fungal specific transcription factor domain-containing protein n=1 Tax=Thanatephorus cucumeris (strain AG1-IA) TaxID=983506 RepID=L8WTX9_THACA|nr:fungal specific transcription factor domain-containing protein [Rhizoctonia solani AG-1 IA]